MHFETHITIENVDWLDSPDWIVMDNFRSGNVDDPISTHTFNKMKHQGTQHSAFMDAAQAASDFTADGLKVLRVKTETGFYGCEHPLYYEQHVKIEKPLDYFEPWKVFGAHAALSAPRHRKHFYVTVRAFTVPEFDYLCKELSQQVAELSPVQASFGTEVAVMDSNQELDAAWL